MKYLKTIILENFQSHKHTIMDFSEGLNVIVGPSDTGKSAIIRAIKWALYNEPSGDYFIREGESDVSVTLIFNDKTKIKRYRSKSKNQYILYDNLGQEIKYEGFGLGVPEEIVEKVGIKKIYLDSDETNSINLGEQLDGAFLLSEKTSTRASAIGRLIGVNVIDDALKETLKDVRNSSIEKKNKDQDIVLITKELEAFDYLKGLNSRLKQLEKIKEKIKIKDEKKDKLIKLSLKYNKYNKELKTLNFYLERLNTIEELDKVVKQIEIINKDYRYYTNGSEKLKNCKDKINKNISIIDRLNGIDRILEIENSLEINLDLKSKLLGIKSKNNSINLEMKNTNNKLSKLENIPKIQSMIDDSSIKIAYLHELQTLNTEYKTNQDSIRKGKQYIINFNYIGTVDSNYNILEKKISDIVNLIDKKTSLDKVKNYISSEENRCKGINAKIDKNLSEYKDLLKQNEVCPLCLSNIDDEKLDHIIQNLK